MRAQLRTLWALRTSRERTVIAAILVTLGTVLFAAFVVSANRARTELRASVTTLRADAMRLDRDAAEIERLRAVPPATASHSDLRQLLEAQTNATGLSAALIRMEAAGPDQVSIVLGAASFADWLTLLQRLQAQHVRLETSRLEALASQGTVSVTATFTRAPTP